MTGRWKLDLSFVAAGALAAAVAAACGGGEDGPVGPGASSGSPAPDAGLDVTTAAPLCVDGKGVDWPPGPHEIAVMGTLPKDLVFEGPDGPVRLADSFEPCAERSRLLVVRTAAPWCGSCGWHVTHTNRLLSDPRLAGRVVLVDLIIADEDNAAPTVAAAARWKSRIDAPGKVGIDAKYTFAPVTLPHSPLPTYVVIDTRRMVVTTVVDNPSPEKLVSRLAVELADLDGTPRGHLQAPTLNDGLFTEDQWDMIRDMKLAAEPPADPTNAFGDLPAAVALGRKLFDDPGLSPSGTVSCATCHVAAQGFSDGVPQSTGGVTRLDRNSPSIALAAHARWQFWDGRADTLWAQALGPIEDAKEMGSSRLFVAKQIASRYAAEYDAVFGAAHPRPDLSALPASGKPGDATYDALPQAERDGITRMFVNVGKAIAAFERSLRVKPNALDRYAGGDLTALTPPQKLGLSVFFRTGCAQCHFGPRLSNDSFHVLRFGTGRQDQAPDRGRIDVLGGLAAREFVGTSRWSDSPSSAKALLFDPAASPWLLGAFKTPTLRGLPKTAPYGHGGMQATLLDVARHYGQRGLVDDSPLATGTTEEWVTQFDHGAQRDLVPFLEILEAEVEAF